MRPVVAVMPLVDDERESLWMLPGYMNALREAGAVPFMPALTTDRQEIGQIFGMCDGLVMTGGHDVNPACYGESNGNTAICTAAMRGMRWNSRCLNVPLQATNRCSAYAVVCRS